MAIDYLIIGHVTQDLKPQGAVPGGTAFYSAVTAQRLGCKVGLVTCAPRELVEQVQRVAPGMEVHVVPAERATTFENHYRGNDRVQFVHHVAPPIRAEDIPRAWRRAPIVHLAPVAREVELSLAGEFPTALVCVTPQGWLRRWDESGRVMYAPLADERGALKAVDVLVFSAEDVNHDPAAMRALIRAVPIAVVTSAAEGAVLYSQDGVRPSPARPVTVQDPTGAGDVFAAALFTRLFQRGDPYEAANYANLVASFSIEQVGTEGIPTRPEVDSWFARQERGK